MSQFAANHRNYDRQLRGSADMTRAAATVGSGSRRGAVSVRHLAPALDAGVMASCRVLGFARAPVAAGICIPGVGLWTQWRSGQDEGRRSSGCGCVRLRLASVPTAIRKGV